MVATPKRSSWLSLLNSIHFSVPPNSVTAHPQSSASGSSSYHTPQAFHSKLWPHLVKYSFLIHPIFRLSISLVLNETRLCLLLSLWQPGLGSALDHLWNVRLLFGVWTLIPALLTTFRQFYGQASLLKWRYMNLKLPLPFDLGKIVPNISSWVGSSAFRSFSVFLNEIHLSISLLFSLHAPLATGLVPPLDIPRKNPPDVTQRSCMTSGVLRLALCSAYKFKFTITMTRSSVLRLISSVPTKISTARSRLTSSYRRPEIVCGCHLVCFGAPVRST